MNDTITYNISTKSTINAIDICKKINKNKDKYNVKNIYNKERILFVTFNNNVSDKSIKKITKLIG